MGMPGELIHWTGKKPQLPGIVLVSLMLGLFPFFVDIFWIRLVAEFAILALFALAYNLILGQTGLFSFGHGGLFGLGAYLLAVPVIKGVTSLPVAFVASLFLTTMVSFVIGWFCLRLTGIYFSILTLAFSQLIWVAIWKFRSVTGGDDGLIGLNVPSLFASPVYQYFFILAVVTLSLVMIRIINNSAFGFTLKAIRENSRRAAFTGINVKRYQLMAFTVSGFFTGLAGVIFSIFTRGAFVEFASVSKSFEPVFAAIVGGVNTFTGPIIGAGFMLALNHFIGRFTEYWPSMSGIILISVVLFLPRGIVGTFASLAGRMREATGHVQNEGVKER